MKLLKNIFIILLMVFLFFSLIKNIVNYRSKFQFYEEIRQAFEKENKTNIELKTEIVKKKSRSEIEKTIRNKLNLLKENEVALIIPPPEITPIPPTPTPLPNYLQWFKLFVK